jgi:lipocalin
MSETSSGLRLTTGPAACCRGSKEAVLGTLHSGYQTALVRHPNRDLHLWLLALIRTSARKPCNLLEEARSRGYDTHAS